MIEFDRTGAHVGTLDHSGATLEEPNRPDERPFGIANLLLGPRFVVLDKSFLDAVNSAQLQYYAQKGIIFGVTDVLKFELMRKSNDAQRTRSLLKLSEVQELVLLPGVGEMFRAESANREPAPSIMIARRLNVTPLPDSDNPFALTPAEKLATDQRTAQLQDEKLPDVMQVWHDLGSMPQLRDVPQAEMPEKLIPLRREIFEDRDSMRQFYENHRQPPFLPGSLIDERWALFRWTQVYLLAGLDFVCRHRPNSEPNRERLLHELLDLDYTITALLVGGLACRENRIIERFRFLGGDGFVLRGPR